MRVLSLYDSSLKVSNSAIASSKACLAKWQALKELEQVSQITIGAEVLPEINYFYVLPFRGIHNLIVEDRKIECKAKTDWVG